MLDYAHTYAQYYQWIEKVSVYAKSMYEVKIELLAEEGAFIYEPKGGTIQVKGETPPRDKLYILLHEVGHLFRINENCTDNTFFMDRNGDNNPVEKVMTLMEEVLAWQKADEIAKRLDIPIEKRAWQRLVNKSISKYADWACNREV